MRPLPIVVTLAVLLAPMMVLAASPIHILAAENFYGDVAQQIGGPDVAVTNILRNPDQDPHLFEVSPSVARDVSAAQIVLYNGLDYDPWMAKLLQASPRPGRIAIEVGGLAQRHAGDNPHIWYDAGVMLRFVAVLAADLAKLDPVHAADYRQRLAAFRASLQPVQAKIAALRARLAGQPVTATEPVFGYMLAALGLDVRNMAFQRAVMNNTEPSASQVVGFEDDLQQHRVRLLIFNNQASDPIAERMVRLAKASHVPVMGATETEPSGTKYQAWMMNELDAVSQALPE